MGESSKNDGLDVAGLGKIASAIPKEVYEKSATTLLNTFEKLTAPITETTSGLGRYLRQKFDNMVEAEKAIATYTVEKAIMRVHERFPRGQLRPPEHPKTFVKAIEEASKETDPILHEMWTNLLASQLSDNACHPHFVEVLPHFSSSEAKTLISLLPMAEVGEHEYYVSISPDAFKHWIPKNIDQDLRPWTISCDLLLEFRFGHVVGPKPARREVAIMYRTPLGCAFLQAVGEPGLVGNALATEASYSDLAISTERMRSMVRDTMHSVSGEVISVDTTPIQGPTGQVLLIPFDRNQTVFAFLSQIHWAFRERVGAYTYGTRWVLEDTIDGAVYDAGSDSERSRLMNVPIGKLGFRAGMKLRTIWVTADSKNRRKLPATNS